MAPTEEKVEPVKTPVKIYMNGEEAGSVDGEDVTSVVVMGGVVQPGAVPGSETLPVNVYVLTKTNPEPTRPPTEAEAEAQKKADEDLKKYQDEQAASTEDPYAHTTENAGLPEDGITAKASATSKKSS